MPVAWLSQRPRRVSRGMTCSLSSKRSYACGRKNANGYNSLSTGTVPVDFATARHAHPQSLQQYGLQVLRDAFDKDIIKWTKK